MSASTASACAHILIDRLQGDLAGAFDGTFAAPSHADVSRSKVMMWDEAGD